VQAARYLTRIEGAGFKPVTWQFMGALGGTRTPNLLTVAGSGISRAVRR
jgi:hypothetical protein